MCFNGRKTYIFRNYCLFDSETLVYVSETHNYKDAQ